MENYLNNSDSAAKIREEREILTVQEQMEEFMFLGLRMTKEFPWRGFTRCLVYHWSRYMGKFWKNIREWRSFGRDGRVFAPYPEGDKREQSYPGRFSAGLSHSFSIKIQKEL